MLHLLCRHFACLADSPECVSALTDHGADPKLQDKLDYDMSPSMHQT